MRLQIDPTPGHAFHAEMRLRALPGVVLADASGSGMDCRNTAAFIEDDDLVLSIVYGGAAIVRQRGREHVLRDGGAVLNMAGEPSQTVVPGTARMKTIRLPVQR